MAIGRGNSFIDNTIKVLIDRLEQIKRHRALALIAIHVAMRPSLLAGEDKPVPCRETLSLLKLVW